MLFFSRKLMLSHRWHSPQSMAYARPRTSHVPPGSCILLVSRIAEAAFVPVLLCCQPHARSCLSLGRCAPVLGLRIQYLHREPTAMHGNISETPVSVSHKPQSAFTGHTGQMDIVLFPEHSSPVRTISEAVGMQVLALDMSAGHEACGFFIWDGTDARPFPLRLATQTEHFALHRFPPPCQNPMGTLPFLSLAKQSSGPGPPSQSCIAL